MYRFTMRVIVLIQQISSIISWYQPMKSWASTLMLNWSLSGMLRSVNIICTILASLPYDRISSEKKYSAASLLDVAANCLRYLNEVPCSLPCRSAGIVFITVHFDLNTINLVEKYSDLASERGISNGRIQSNTWPDFGMDMCSMFKLTTLRKYLKILHFKVALLFNLQFTKRENGGYSFTCQHGPSECYGNLIHACLLDKLTDNSAEVAAIGCLMEDYTDNEQALKKVKKCSNVMSILWIDVYFSVFDKEWWKLWAWLLWNTGLCHIRTRGDYPEKFWWWNWQFRSWTLFYTLDHNKWGKDRRFFKELKVSISTCLLNCRSGRRKNLRLLWRTLRQCCAKIIYKMFQNVFDIN